MNKFIKSLSLTVLFVFSFAFANQVDELYYSKSISFDLPKNIKVSFDLGAGHGDILEPFPEVKLNITKEKLDQTNTTKEEFHVKELTKKIVTDLVVNKATDYLNNGNSNALSNLPPIFSWLAKRILKNGKLYPLEVFLFKAYLLFRMQIEPGYESSKNVEYLALLLKLAISKPLTGFVNVDSQNALELLDKIQDYVEPEFLGFLTEIFLSYQDNFSDCDFNNINIESDEKTKVGFVFANKQMAKACYELFKYNTDYETISDFKKRVENFIQEYVIQAGDVWSAVTNYKVVSFNNFKEHKNSSFKFVGFEDFGVDVSYPVLEKNVEGLKTVNKNFSVYLDEKSDDENWVYCVAKNDSGLNYKIIKYFVAAIFKAVDEYKKINSYDATEILNKIDLDTLKMNYKNFEAAKISLENSISNIEKEIKEKEEKISSGWLWNSWFKEKNQEEVATLNKEKEINVKKLNIIIAKMNELDATICNYDIDSFLVKVKDKSFSEVLKIVILSDVRIAKIINNIMSKPEYKIVKDNIIKRMGLIFSNSKLVREYWNSIEYVLINAFPLFESEIKEFGNNLNVNSNLSELLIGLVK
ncbi:hypothetical protein KJ644_04765 [Candidatus Dependentiae bacterium]|nr:hypothetical protein [Candidatus Dependentiae bacterium]MBU4387746.1 hypothetical protein [Candidatus Dependentiae bacterium]MCG2756338.1 hypothetical protein [Candidatus Dependentiae bacterium]